jgi:hypothetical protein
VPKSVLKDGVSNEELSNSVSETVIDAEALNREPEEVELTETVIEALNEEGIRVVHELDSTDEESIPKVKRMKKFGKDTNAREARALSEFVITDSCRRKVWDTFFENGKKCN